MPPKLDRRWAGKHGFYPTYAEAVTRSLHAPFLLVLLTLAPGLTSAQALRALDSFEAGESPADLLRTQLIEQLGEPRADRALTTTGRVHVVQDFCQGCQRAHLWVVNVSFEPVFWIEARVTLRHSRSGQSDEQTMFLPAVPARSAARLSFEVPWPERETVWIRLGEPLPTPGVISVDYPPVIFGRPVNAALVEQTIARRTQYSVLDGRRGRSHSSVLFVLDRTSGEGLFEFATLFAATDGGPEQLRAAALRNLGGAGGPALVRAIPEEQRQAFLDEAVRRPGAFGAMLGRADQASFEALRLLLSERPSTDRRVFVNAAMQAETPSRFEEAAALVPAEEHAYALRAGWMSLHADDPLLSARLAWLRSIEDDDEDRGMLLRALERRRIDRGTGVPDGARSELARLRDSLPHACDEIYAGELGDIQPFEVEDLRAAGIDLATFHESGRLELHGCGDPRDLEDLERCVASLEGQPELAAIARASGLRQPFLDTVGRLLGEGGEPSRRVDLALRYAPFGFLADPLGERLCADSRAVLGEEVRTFVEAARRIDPAASCVVEEDAAIAGMDPTTLGGLVLLLLLSLGVIGAGAAWLRKQHAARAAAMKEIMGEPSEPDAEPPGAGTS